ncbi:restriction endonuclease subunit S [Streptomyces kunmingensis]|uniref:Restriction endonuclease subunit S n=1 Tax=Streptomyces kunmingensis TaxID=68225 RepID=A0ABU6CK79_9ACTN|nr:restriction endonuclease subunit S [Streptomyces kunmingensis]MEB3964641.1 restriction endonuclease subunit S [Streptomyces kunmingensis]
MTAEWGAGPGDSADFSGDGLPEGWALVSIGELCEVNPRGFDEEPDDDDLISQVPMAAVEAETGRMDASAQVRYGDLKKKSLTRFQENDVLFAKITPCMENGKIVVARGLTDGRALGSTEFHVLRSRGSVLPKYLMHYLLQRNVRCVAEQHMSGAVGQRRVPRPYLADLEIPVPPLAEQHRIVAKLDEQLAHIEAGEASIGVADRRKDEFLQVVLAQVLRGKLVTEDISEGEAGALVPDPAALADGPWDVPKSWRWASIGSLFKVAVGATPARDNSEHWTGDIPWVSSGEVAFGRISGTRESISVGSMANPAARIHPPGTVMIAMIGEGRTRGQAAILDIAAAHNQNCASIRVSETQILPEFVYYFLKARYEETRLEASGGNQPALNKSKIQALAIPIPPLGTQRNIVARVQELESDLLDLQEAVTGSRAQASKLRSALLHAAFNGTLVPQDPTDEPASMLLDRIRAQRAAAEAKPTPRKRTPRKPTQAAAPATSGRPVPSGTQEALPL